MGLSDVHLRLLGTGKLKDLIDQFPRFMFVKDGGTGQIVFADKQQHSAAGHERNEYYGGSGSHAHAEANYGYYDNNANNSSSDNWNNGSSSARGLGRAGRRVVAGYVCFFVCMYIYI